MSAKKSNSRRDFLKGSAAAVAGATLAGSLSIARSAHAVGSDQLKVAVIGCGGRGRGAAENVLEANPAVKIVALADAFDNRVQEAAKRLRGHKEYAKRVDVPDDRLFVGLDCHEKALACDVDMVILTAPPGFRPVQYMAAVKAGKHVFMEKPCCVDAEGYRTLVEANKIADQKKLKVGVGFQRHHQASYVETIKRIHDGALGKILFLRAYWNGSGIWYRKREPEMNELQFQVHNWYHFCWLSGDNICEQHFHNIDVCNWVMQGHPVEANGMGGCTARYLGAHKGMGQIFDHHFVEFTYADGTKMFSQCRHMANCFNNVSEAAHGTKGESNCANEITGANPWKFEGKSANPYVQEHVDLIQAIQTGQQYNEGPAAADSSMTTVLGRMATYSGQVVKWDDAVAKGKGEFISQLSWNAKPPVVQDKDGNYPIPMPGVYKAY